MRIARNVAWRMIIVVMVFACFAGGAYAQKAQNE